ncbi:MAG TPA: hypothetical protein PLJ27_11330 [Polyangiaceae bacterium]|nr:hypothetical protein [Polyangiaceae bacterium]
MWRRLVPPLACMLAPIGVIGCVLPDFDNGVGPSPHTGGGTQQDVVSEWPEFDSGPDSEEDIAMEAEPDVDIDASFCETHPEGTVCGESGICDEKVCVAGVCELVLIPDGVECEQAPNACWKPGVCESGQCTFPVAFPDGYNWKPGDNLARCCKGEPRMVNTNDDCGVCGIKCDTSDGQSCKRNPANNRYYCEGCQASAKCWSGCCSESFMPIRRCAASDCSTGACVGCPQGTSCVTSSVASNVCTYD